MQVLTITLHLYNTATAWTGRRAGELLSRRVREKKKREEPSLVQASDTRHESIFDGYEKRSGGVACSLQQKEARQPAKVRKRRESGNRNRTIPHTVLCRRVKVDRRAPLSGLACRNEVTRWPCWFPHPIPRPLTSLPFATPNSRGFCGSGLKLLAEPREAGTHESRLKCAWPGDWTDERGLRTPPREMGGCEVS